MEKEYRKILKFNFKGNYYQLLLDKENKYFFLKINPDNSFSYVTIEELIALHNLFTNFPKVMNAEKNKNKNSTMKLVPRVIIGGTLVTLSLSTLLTGCALNNSEYLYNYYYGNNSGYTAQEERKIETELSFEVKDSDEPLEQDTYLESDLMGYLYVYDNDYINKAFDYPNVSAAQIYTAINNNAKIPSRFKKLLTDYVTMIINKYPNAELRILFENIKDLEIVECTKDELVLKTLSMDTYGCYVAKENKIYVPQGYEYVNGTWEYQVIMHEFGHALRTRQFNKGETEVKLQIGGLNVFYTTMEEALNSIFTVSLFDYEERDIAYQLQSNYYSIIIECLDNYSLEDYTHHSLSYFTQKMDEQTGYNNYATVIAELIETQYKDYHSDSMDISQDQFYPLYEYISDLYYNKYLTSDMSYEDAKALTTQLVEKVTFDVPKEYNIDTNYFYEYLDIYLDQKGLSNSMEKLR